MLNTLWSISDQLHQVVKFENHKFIVLEAIKTLSFFISNFFVWEKNNILSWIVYLIFIIC